MPSNIHALVQDAHYEYALVLRHVKHDVRSIFVAPQVGRELVSASTKHWLARKVLEALMHSVQVSLCLRQSEIQSRVLMDSAEIDCRSP